MATIKQLKQNGEPIYPVTYVDAVYNNNGDNLTYLMNSISNTMVVNVTTWEEFIEVLRGEKSENNRGVNIIIHYESDKTFSEIQNAINDGDNVLLSFNDRVYNLSRAEEDFISFVNNDIYNGDAHMTSFTIDSFNEVFYSAHEDVSEGALARSSELDSFVPRPYGYDNQIVRMDGTGNIQSGDAILTDEGDIWAKKYIIQGSTIANATRLISSDGADNAYFSINGRTNLRVSYTDVAPGSGLARTINLGADGREWNNVYAKKFITWGGREDTFVRGDGVLQGIKTINGYTLMGSGNIELATSADSVLSYTSYNPIQNSPVAYAINNLNDTKQNLLVSGTNIKTINSYSLLGSGNINLAPAADSALNYTSYNPIQNSPVAYAINNLNDTKQNLLVSGINIKTVNSNSLVGEGDVQVGDITGVYLDETIEDLDESLMTYALRKTEQYLKPSEREQVLTNLGINGAVTSSNLKTINGSSILGTGNLEVTVINGGNINVAQSTGDSNVYVMSQKAVSDNIERLTRNESDDLLIGIDDRLPSGYTELDCIDSGSAGSCAVIDTGIYPDDANWRFVGSWMRTGTPNAAYASVITSFTNNDTIVYRICRNNTADGVVRVGAFQKSSALVNVSLSNTGTNVWHTYDLKVGKFIIDGQEYSISADAGLLPTTSLKIGDINYPQKIGKFIAYHNNIVYAVFIPCKNSSNVVGMYDIISNQFYGSSNENTFTAGNVVEKITDKLVNNDNVKGVISQELGDSQYKVISQKTITEMNHIFTEDDYNGISETIKTKLKERGWLLNTALQVTTAKAMTGVCVSPLINGNIVNGHTLFVRYYNTVSGTKSFTVYNDNDEYVGYHDVSNNERRITNTLTGSKFRITLNMSRLRDCFILDETTGEYLFNGANYLDEIINDFKINYEVLQNHILQSTGDNDRKTMSQDAISKELKVAANTSNATYITGRLAYLKFDDYPEFDPRTCDGISLIINSSAMTADRIMLFGINDASAFNNGCGAVHFGLWINWGNLVFGKCTNYGNATDGGYAYSIGGTERHLVFTYNFITGAVKFYKNGVLISTQTPSSYDEQTYIRTYFNACTHILMSAFKINNGGKINGMALFGNVLSDSDVSEIYGNGNSSIKNILIPEKWEANYLHPLSVTGWTINFFTNGGVATQNNDGGYTITPASGYTNVYFGFNDISVNVKNNLIYEWDFEITSGSSTHDSGDRMSRAIRLGNNYVRCFTIYDSNGNDVTLSTLGIGTYHVVSKPDNIGRLFNATSSNFLHYYFICSSDFSMTISPILKITERGAALEYSTKTYKGAYWLQSNGIKLPINPDYYYSTENFKPHSDLYIEDVVNYSSSVKPQFNGQMAINTTNGNVYVGYLNGSTGTWKQINNS